MKERLRRILPWLVLGTLTFGIMVPLPSTESSDFRDYLRDLGHFPASALLFWVVWSVPQVRWRKWPRVLVVVVMVLLLQTGFELLQPLTGRSASLRDWTLGLMGISLAVMVCQFLKRRRIIWVFMAVGLTVAAFFPLVLMLKQQRAHAAAFPLFGSFESKGEIKRWDLYGLEGTLSDDYVSIGEKSVRFVVTKEFSYPGFFMERTVTDWSDYAAFTCDIFLEGDHPRTIVLRADDHQETLPYGDRGQVGFNLKPGFNTVVVPIHDLMKTPGGRVMNATHITRYGLFFEEKFIGDVFYVDAVQLQ